MTGDLELQLRFGDLRRARAPRLVGSIKIFPSYWGFTPEEDAIGRCLKCGQLLGKRCRRDGCGEQVTLIAVDPS